MFSFVLNWFQPERTRNEIKTWSKKYWCISALCTQLNFNLICVKWGVIEWNNADTPLSKEKKNRCHDLWECIQKWMVLRHWAIVLNYLWLCCSNNEILGTFLVIVTARTLQPQHTELKTKIYKWGFCWKCLLVKLSVMLFHSVMQLPW